MTTIKDIAKEADVSVATVSRALNSPETLSPETLKRVRKAIDDFGYAPNKIARSLKSQASKTVGLITSDITNPFLIKVIKGAEKTLFNAGYTPIICDSEENIKKEDRYLRDLIERRIDGLILIPVLERLKLPPILQNIPTVFVDRSLSATADCVKSNNYTGISLLVRHLADGGRREIAFVGGPEESMVGHERNDAFKKVCAELGIETREDFAINGDFTVAGGYEAACALLGKTPRPDSIVSANNLMGIGILKALRDRNLDRTGDIEIATFDELGELVGARYCYIQQPAFEMGMEAGKMLLDRMDGKQDLSPRLLQFEPELRFNAF